MAEVGFMPKASGIKMAMPETGPIPGNAPMMVPATTPNVTKIMFMGLNAMENPMLKLLIRSITAFRNQGSPEKRQNALGQRHPKPHREYPVQTNRRQQRN